MILEIDYPPTLLKSIEGIIFINIAKEVSKTE